MRGAPRTDARVSRVLINVAIDQFGRFGFDGASTRSIAKASGTPMSSITYHFGGKEGLYLAATDYVARIGSRCLERAFAATAPEAPESRDDALETLLAMADCMAQLMLKSTAKPWLRFCLRELQVPGAAFERLAIALFDGPVERLTALVLLARPELSPTQARAMVVTVFGQLTMLRTGRALAARIMNVPSFERVTRDLLRAQLQADCLSMLSAKPWSD